MLHDDREIKKIAFIYCVGSRQKAETENANRYCSRYCCSTATHLSVLAKKKFPRKAKAIIFTATCAPTASSNPSTKSPGKADLFSCASTRIIRRDLIKEGDSWLVTVQDLSTGGEEIAVAVDLVVLVTGMTARRNDELTRVLKLPLGSRPFL